MYRFKTAPNLYNYFECFKWCCEHMPSPSESYDHIGTWGCNGEYVWWAYASGSTDPHRSDATSVLDLCHKEYKGVIGSSCMYSFSALTYNAPIIKSRFLPCFCVKCQRADFQNCFFRQYVGTMTPNTCNLKCILNMAETTNRTKKQRENAKKRTTARAKKLGLA